MSKFSGNWWHYTNCDGECVIWAAHNSSGIIDVDIATLTNLYGETEANARLIAAAPKMYERLKLIARLLSRQAQGQLRDAIDPAIADTIYELLAEIDNEPVETMKYSSSFFQNRNCEYFPCHEAADTERFSCLFCFCPLYHMEKCGGNYRILSNGVKDCSECTMPHTDYNRVISMLKETERAEKQS